MRTGLEPATPCVTGRLARKPEWDGRFQNPEIGLDGEYRVLVDEGGNAYYVNGWQCVIIDPEGIVF